MSIIRELQPIKNTARELTFGEIIRCTREILGMKQYRMAQILGIPTPKLKNIEINAYRNQIEKSILIKFSEAFEFDVLDLQKSVANRLVDHQKIIKLIKCKSKDMTTKKKMAQKST